ncbi:hypothetical protein HYW44_02010 [Candidatus Daviesbacteria bacterium]|nr:hypothetical protein [Candidatus Daviesbacteria bacterium]
MSKFSPERRIFLRNFTGLAAAPLAQALERETQVITATALGVSRLAPQVLEPLRAEAAYQAELLFPERYSGQIAPFENLPYIGPEKLKKLLVILDQTGDPLLRKVSSDVRLLSVDPTTADIPDWAAFERKPFPLVSNPRTMDSILAFLPRTFGTPKDQIVLRDNQGKSYGFNDFDKVFLGIQLANSPEVKKAGMFDEAVFLAKEVLTMEMLLRMSQELHHLMKTMGVEAFDSSGNPLREAPRIKRAGEILWFIESSDDNTFTWKVIDTLPTALLAVSLGNLMNRGKFNIGKDSTLGNVTLGVHLLNLNPVIKSRFQGLSSEWVRSGQLLPPAGITQEMFFHPYSTFLNMYQKEMLKRG